MSGDVAGGRAHEYQDTHNVVRSVSDRVRFRSHGTDQHGQVLPTGYFNTRPGFHTLMRGMGVDERVMTLNELFANPKLNVDVMRRLGAGQASISISGEEAVKTAEF